MQVGENTLRNVHLRPFRDAVDAGVQAVMASFNDIDGVPMHANRHLLRDVLKGEWGFDGLVVADWSGVAELQDHGVAADAREAARLAILAGVDLEMVSDCYDRHLADLVESGEVPREVLTDAVRRVLRVKVRAGLFERPYARERVLGAMPHTAPTEASRAVARRAAVAASVLVKNTNDLLPLSPDLSGLHLVGPFGSDGEALLGTWVLDGRGDEVVPPEPVLRARLGDRLIVSDGRFSDLAMQRSRGAGVFPGGVEAIVMLLGEHPARSGEANSISDLRLPAGQIDVLRQQARLGKPLVAVVYTGRPLDLSDVLEVADAVLVCFHPGVEAGPALDAVLFGDAEPAGRLPVSFPRSSGHLPFSHLGRRTSRPIDPLDDARVGRYLDALTQSSLPFGHGSGYTTFELAHPHVSEPQVARDGTLNLQVDVTNTGRRPGRALVQLYLSDPVAALTRPRYELLDWRWVAAEPGRVATASFEVSAAQFGYYGPDRRFRVDAGSIRLSVGFDSAHPRSVDITVV